MAALDDAKAIEIVEQAFRPLKCVAKVWHYGTKLKLKVTDRNGRGVFRIEDVPDAAFRDSDDLREFIELMREDVIEKGYKLDPLKR